MKQDAMTLNHVIQVCRISEIDHSATIDAGGRPEKIITNCR